MSPRTRALLPLHLLADSPAVEPARLPGGNLDTAPATATATAVFSVYPTVVHLVTVPDDWSADRLRRACGKVTAGRQVIMAGHFVPAALGATAFLTGLALGAGLPQRGSSAGTPSPCSRPVKPGRSWPVAATSLVLVSPRPAPPDRHSPGTAPDESAGRPLMRWPHALDPSHDMGADHGEPARLDHHHP